MAYPNNPLFDLLRALDPQQANANAEQSSTTQPQTAGADATNAQDQTPPHPFAAFAPFFAFPSQPNQTSTGRRQGPNRRCPRSECPAMNPEARGPLDAEAESHTPHAGRHHHGGRHGRGGWAHGAREPPAYAAFGGQGAPFDLSAFVNSLASHPVAEALRTCADDAVRGAAPADPNTAPAGEIRGADESDAFAPAVDTFSTPTEYVLHVALPGAKKEDVGVNWDAEKGELNIAGVVYRAGDEEFIASLKTGERRVGVFERSVKLPLEADEKVEVDGEEITAKLEDGVLVVRVGKVIREEAWTDLKRVEVL